MQYVLIFSERRADTFSLIILYNGVEHIAQTISTGIIVYRKLDEIGSEKLPLNPNIARSIIRHSVKFSK